MTLDIIGTIFVIAAPCTVKKNTHLHRFAEFFVFGTTASL